MRRERRLSKASASSVIASAVASAFQHTVATTDRSGNKASLTFGGTQQKSAQQLVAPSDRRAFHEVAREPTTAPCGPERLFLTARHLAGASKGTRGEKKQRARTYLEGVD